MTIKPVYDLNSNIKVEISIDNQNDWMQINNLFNEVTLKILSDTIFDTYQKKVLISVLLTDDINMKQINFKWRGQNNSTNVLSFPSDQKTKQDEFLVLGDIVFSFEKVKREADEKKISFFNHFNHLLLHGLLHLLGFDHIDMYSSDKMENLEINILSKNGIKNPY